MRGEGLPESSQSSERRRSTVDKDGSALWVRIMKAQILICSLLLTGCAGLNTGVDNLRNKAAEGYDSALELAERIQCNDASVGSIKRRFGKTKESAELYNQWCANSGTIDVNLE